MIVATFLAKTRRFVLATLAWLLLLLLVYVAHVRLLAVDVVFYAALLDVALALVLALAALSRLRWFEVFNAFEKAQMLLAWALLGYAWAISVPTVIDRSLSFYMLEKLQQNGGSMPYASFEPVFTRGYAREHRLVDVRLTEQVASGTMVIEGDCVRLTERGKQLANFSRWFRTALLPRQRRLLDRYSGELTAPLAAEVGAGACAATPAPPPK